jgi:teichuronic acid biosynthesis glycosyltransferase TuaC
MNTESINVVANTVYYLHVGDPLPSGTDVAADTILYRLCFNDGRIHPYRKQDIVNVDEQMAAIAAQSINVDVGYLTGRKSPLALLRAGLKLRREITSPRYQYLHVYGGSTMAFIAVVFAKVPVIVSLLGSDLLGNVSADGRITLDGRISRALSRFAARRSAWVVTMSEHMKETLPARVQRKTSVIPNGVDLSTFRPMDRGDALVRTGWDTTRKHVVFFRVPGAVVKDYPLAARVFGLIKKDMGDVEFQLVHGVPHEDMVYYYNAADVMLLTSFHEGSNNSLKEAMACNLPIVSVVCGDARERLRGVRASTVVPTRAAADLAVAAIDILRRGERSNGSEFLEPLGFERNAFEVYQVYRHLDTVSGGPGTRPQKPPADRCPSRGSQ